MSSSTFTAMNGQEPLSKNEPASEPTSSLPIPYDLVLNCLARVSRLHYPALSLVSKSFRSLISSPELYKTRSLLNRTESCLYVCLRFPFDRNPSFFTLCRKPDKTSKQEGSSGNLLVPVSIHNSPSVKWSSLIAVGPNLYAISGPIQDSYYSSFSFLDCRTHTWLEAPNLRLAHADTELDGKIYLAGSCENLDSLNCIEVFDTKTQTWKPVPPEKRTFEPRNMEGKILHGNGLSGKKCLAVMIKKFAWEALGFDTDKRSVCMINNITFCYEYHAGEFIWLDAKVKGEIPKKVMGLEGLPKFASYSAVKLVDYGGKMVILWDKYVPSSGCKEKMIWCAEVAVRRKNGEIWGKVEWFDAVLKVPKSYKFVCGIAATV